MSGIHNGTLETGVEWAPTCGQCDVGFMGDNCELEAPCVSAENGCPEVNFVSISGGAFEMGSTRFADEQPIHTVMVNDFEMSQSEVTIGQYRVCVDAGVCSAPSGDYSEAPNGRENHPVRYVSWGQAKTFADFIGARLPTEAEWEFAGRNGGQTIVYPWGDEAPNCDWLNFDSCVDDTTPVCTYSASNTTQGLCDMAGNLWEWIEDDYHDSYTGGPNDASAWVDSPRGPQRVIRGGSFDYSASYVRAADRRMRPPSDTLNYLGFRLARSVP